MVPAASYAARFRFARTCDLRIRRCSGLIRRRDAAVGWPLFRACCQRRQPTASLAGRSVRITSGTNRRLRVFAVTQIAASFVLLAGAGMLLTTLFSLQRQQSGFRPNLLAVNVPVVSYTRKPEEVTNFYQEVVRRVSQLPGVEQVAIGTVVPWRDPGFFAAQFTAEGYQKANGEEDPRAQFRTVSPGFFSSLDVKLIAGRDFNDGDSPRW